MKKILCLLSALVLVIGLHIFPRAELIDMGDETIYDTDLQITWLKDAGMVGVKNWNDAREWADNLVFAGIDNWRLPIVTDQTYGYNITGSEMGYLYYISLGNPAGTLINTGPFINLYGPFWSGTEYSLDPDNIMNPGKMGLTDDETDIYDYFAFSNFKEHPENVKSFGKDIDDEILICVQCGFCRAGCPTFNETTLESLNARGRVLLCYGLLSGQIEPNQEVADKIYQCTTCMNCTTSCPSGIKVAEVIERIRQFLVEKGFVIPNHAEIADRIASSHNPFGEPATTRDDLANLASTEKEGGGSNE